MADQIFRHRNGYGRIIGTEGAVSSDSFVDRSSTISGKAYISFMSQIRNNSQIIGDPEKCSASCSVTDESIVVNSEVVFSKIEGSALNGVVVRGTHDPALLRNMILSGGVVVEGCKLTDFELSGAYLLHSDFDREPRHFDLKEFGIPLHIIECRCRKGILSGIIGCCCRTLSDWIENREFSKRLFAKRFDWKPQVGDFIVEHFREWLSQDV